MEMLIENALNIGTDEFYRALRYRLSLVVMLINTQNKDAFNILEKMIRKSDVLQQIDSDTIVIFLSHTTKDESTLFIDKIKDKFNFSYTVSEYNGEKNKESEFKFLESLFLKNGDKHLY
ncbi:hypothetical protein [Sulfurimonas sp.]|uniref:hypothetical protein n=1 Tax=Sulfurimonas sp. TaxID=2022749 RepID=UPI002B479C63|nr:hypothetical protein [Sulfurimonas sp.]